MCEITPGVKIAKRDFKVYKIVRRGRYSQYPPGNRGPVLCSAYGGTRPTKGKTLQYTKGRVIVSPSGPGIMAYRGKQAFLYPGSLRITLLVRKGTRYFNGTNDDYRCVCAAKVKVLD